MLENILIYGILACIFIVAFMPKKKPLNTYERISRNTVLFKLAIKEIK